MLTFYPEFESKTSAGYEVVFFLDLSNSMKGKALSEAKKVLLLALHHLPSSCLFNVVTFGTCKCLVIEISRQECCAFAFPFPDGAETVCSPTSTRFQTSTSCFPAADRRTKKIGSKHKLSFRYCFRGIVACCPFLSCFVSQEYTQGPYSCFRTRKRCRAARRCTGRCTPTSCCATATA